MKTTWYVKELSKLTGIAVSTLHHYDAIGLLVPTVRRDNGYRVYSANDLLRLQYIMGLKFLGFSLPKIRELLDASIDMREHLALQQRLIQHKIANLGMVLESLNQALYELQTHQDVSLTSVLQLIEGYRMNQEIENGWRKICTPAEFKQFEVLKSDSKQLAQYHKEWSQFLQEAQSRLDQDPASEQSASFVREGNALFGRIYGSAPKLHTALLRAKKMGVIPDEIIPAPIMAWITQVKQIAGIE